LQIWIASGQYSPSTSTIPWGHGSGVDTTLASGSLEEEAEEATGGVSTFASVLAAGETFVIGVFELQPTTTKNAAIDFFTTK